ncbi:Retrovirus-related Pol polyprotein from transposon TNT 1-94 [Cardamine amara subsp. amara]|uniref:Retrovirus-related Pol polyprotein from transposon TNT 1-94 n=1 Tax=Cardamine amara subsp. amara TaxID=228776 RepID=A0ABD1A941_CARAN
MPQEQVVVGPAAGAGPVAGVAQVEGESGVEAGGGEVESQAQISSSQEDSKWIQEDQLVLAVLQSSLEPRILASYSYIETAKELWDTLLGVYGNESNLSRIFEIKKALNNLQQEGKDFKDLFGEFRGLWAELEMLRPPTIDIKEIVQRREQDQVFGLLLALDESYFGLVHHILRFEKLPTLNQACMMIQKEEGSRGLFKGSSKVAHVSKGKEVGLVADKKGLWCDHCKKSGHTRDKCWTLYPHLRPKNFKTGQVSRGVASASVATSEETVRKSDLDALIKSITKLAESGKGFFASRTRKPVIVDSGASHHMISDRELLSNVEPHGGKFTIANGQDVEIRGIGNLEVFRKKLKALYMPDFSNNLLSVQKATKDLDCVVVFSPDDVKFQDNKSGETIGEGCSKGGLYVLDNKQPNVNTKDDRVALSSFWHERLGHPHIKALQLALPNQKVQDHQHCEACILGKHCRTVFPESSTLYDECFDLVHSDVWTAPCATRDQYKYFVSFIDEKSKYTWITLLPSKSHVLDAFSKFYSYVVTQFGTKIKILRSDNGGEYTSNAFKEFVGKVGIVHQTSCAYTPQQNGVAERKNRHLMEVARTLLFDRSVPKQYWGDAVMTACYLINRLPTIHLGSISPYEVLNKATPFIDHLRVFGCVCYVFVPEAQRNKLEPKSTKCMFIGYSPTQNGYKCYNPTTKWVHVSREVRFLEEKGYFDKKNWNDLEDLVSSVESASTLRAILEGLVPCGSSVEQVNTNEVENEESNSGDPVEDEGVAESESDGTEEEAPSDESTLDPVETAVEEESEESGSEEEDVPPLRRSTRIRFPPENWRNIRVYYNNQAVAHPFQNHCTMDQFPKEHQAFLSEIDKHKIPKSYEEACLYDVWVQAMLEEIDSMVKNETWDEIEKPSKKKLVGCRWVYTIKYASNGEIERYKARLVAKGYTQKHGVDYTETFAPVAKLPSVRILLSIATNLFWDIWQMDVKNAFLQGELKEEVYMVPPEGVNMGNNKVCKLKKAIYGLKQSPRAWYHKLSGCLLENGFRRSEADHTLFTTQGENGIVAVLVYVDDIIVTGDDVEGIKRTKGLLKASFDIKDLGELKYFLGIEVCKFENGLFLSQRKYTLDLLEETGKLGVKPAKTPIEDGYKICPEGEPLMEVKQYQRLVGRLIYLTITRPDISFAVNQVSQHMQTPSKHHWGMIDRILRYLKGTPGKGIWMGRNNATDIVGYCDADWAGDKSDRKSTTGYCTFVGGNLVTWRSKKQKVVSRSSAEAEYRAMANTTGELVWIKAFLKDLGIKSSAPITLHCDNQAAIHIASNSVFHERTKHIEVDCHYVREKVEAGIILPTFVRSMDQLADVFTKATTSKVCDDLHGKMGLLDLHQPILKGSVEMKIMSEDQEKDRPLHQTDGSHWSDFTAAPDRWEAAVCLHRWKCPGDSSGGVTMGAIGRTSPLAPDRWEPAVCLHRWKCPGDSSGGFRE